MLGKAVALAATITACLAATDTLAQEREPASELTAEEMIEVAHEEWRTVKPRGCPAARPGEIVVCKAGDEEFRVESPVDEAIRKGEAVRDGLPRAPYVLGLPECGVEVTCQRVGRAPEPVLMIDLAALPHPLTPEEAALVFRAEDTPPVPATPEAASPAAAP